MDKKSVISTQGKTEEDLLRDLVKIKEHLRSRWDGSRGCHPEKTNTLGRLGEGIYWLTEIVREQNKSDPINQKDV